ncbi:hypothetical protein HRbin04_00352 [archaeon HR04]|nr:hypothetical protein HRbin04_00352 [archaeon HR04]
MDILSVVKGYYARECRMNRLYCSILQQISSKNYGQMLSMVINYLILDTYKNVTVLGEILSKHKDGSMHNTASYVDSIRINPLNLDGGEGVLYLLSTILRIEKDLSQSMVHEYTEFYREEYSSNYYNDDSNMHPTPNCSDEQSQIKSILHCISIDIEKRLNMLSSLASVACATIFCTCGYELPRIVSIDVQHDGCICSKSQKKKEMREGDEEEEEGESRMMVMMLTIHCPRCGKVYHSMVGNSANGSASGKEASKDINCYS